MRWKHREGSCGSPASAAPLQSSSLAFVQEARRHSSGTDELLRVIFRERFIDRHWAMRRCKTKDNRWYSAIWTAAMTRLHYRMYFQHWDSSISTHISLQKAYHNFAGISEKTALWDILYHTYVILHTCSIFSPVIWFVLSHLKSIKIQPPTHSMSHILVQLSKLRYTTISEPSWGVLDQVVQLSYGFRVSRQVATNRKSGKCCSTKCRILSTYWYEYLWDLLVWVFLAVTCGHKPHRSVVENSSRIAFKRLKLRGRIGFWVHDRNSANMVTQNAGTASRCALRACEALKLSTVLMPASSLHSKPAASAVKCSELGIPQERRSRCALHHHLHLHLSIYLSIYLSVYLSIYLSLSLSLSLPKCSWFTAASSRVAVRPSHKDHE